MALPQLPQRLGALDAAFLNFESKEMPLHIGGVCTFDGSIPLYRVRGHHRIQTGPDPALPREGGPSLPEHRLSDLAV